MKNDFLRAWMNLLIPFIGIFLMSCGGPKRGVSAGTEGERFLRNGESVSEATLPAVVRLEIRTENDLFGYCTGTVVSNNAVLTAAHCLVTPEAPKVPTVRLTLDGTTFESDGVAIHPEFSGVSEILKLVREVPYRLTSADLAVIRFSSPLGRAPLALAERLPETGQRVLGVGFGSTEAPNSSGVLRQGTLEFATRLPLTDSTGVRDVEASLGLVSGPTSQIFCSGDSGAPVLLDGKIIAVHSTGTGTCAIRVSSTEVSVPYFHRWISETVERLKSPWTNPRNVLDVNDDGLITPLDVLLIIGELNGLRSLERDVSQSPPRFFDTDANGTLNGNDAKKVITFLEQQLNFTTNPGDIGG